MDALETFSHIVSLWPKSFEPREAWRVQVIEELSTWSAEERAVAIKSLQAIMGRSKTVDMETLRRARRAGKVNHREVIVGNSEAEILMSLGLLEAYKRQHIGDRVMISRLIRCLMHTPGWEATVAQHAGSSRDFADWERLENLVTAANGALTPMGNGKWRKVCYPADKDGWVAPTSQIEVAMPPPPAPRADRAADIEGLKRISAIAAKYGGFRVGDTSNAGAIYNSPEYQQYLKDYTARTGRKPG